MRESAIPISAGLVPLLGPFLFIAVWALVLKLLSVISGWEKLAARYELRGEFSGPRHRFQSGVLSGVRFNNALTVGVSPRGLLLAQLVFFRAFHKPLLIPWSEIRATEARRLWWSGYRLAFRAVPGVWLEVSEPLFAHLAMYVKAQKESVGPPVEPGALRAEES